MLPKPKSFHIVVIVYMAGKLLGSVMYSYGAMPNMAQQVIDKAVYVKEGNDHTGDDNRRYEVGHVAAGLNDLLKSQVGYFIEEQREYNRHPKRKADLKQVRRRVFMIRREKNGLLINWRMCFSPTQLFGSKNGLPG